MLTCDFNQSRGAFLIPRIVSVIGVNQKFESITMVCRLKQMEYGKGGREMDGKTYGMASLDFLHFGWFLFRENGFSGTLSI